MKRLSLLTVLALFCTYLNAQDTIVKLNGDRIVAKIIDVSATAIKYKKFDFQEGPTYVENKTNIQLIKYANGAEEKFESQQPDNIKPVEKVTDLSSGPVNHSNKIEKDGKGYWYQGDFMKEREMHKVLLNSKDQQISVLVGSARKNKRLQRIWIAAVPLVLLGNIFTTNLEDPETQSKLFDGTGAVVCFSGAIAFSISSLYFRQKHNASNKEAIQLFNAKY